MDEKLKKEEPEIENLKKEENIPRKRAKYRAFLQSLHYIRFEFLVSFINLVYVGSGNLYALIIFLFNFEIYDLILGFFFFIFIMSLLMLSFYLTIEEKSSILSIILTSIITFLYAVISLFNVFFIPILILNILSLLCYRNNFKVKPTFKSKKIKRSLYLLFIFLFLPIILSFLFDAISPTITLPAKSQTIDVNFCVEFASNDRLGDLSSPFYSNSSPLSDEVITNLSYWNNNLAHVNISITLAIHEAQLNQDNSSAINCTKRLNSSGISVDAWLLLNQEKGYWPNDANAKHFFNLYNETFREWKNNYSLTYRSLFVDAESFHFSNFQYALLDLITIPLKYWSTQHTEALIEYNKLIDAVHNDSMKIGVTSYQYLVPDDLCDGDGSLQRLVDVSYYPPYGFDYYSVMSYAKGAGSDYSVYLNAKMMKRYNWQDVRGELPGEPAIIFNVFNEPLSSVIKKINILRNLGYQKIFIYSLEGFLDTMPNGLADLAELFQEISTPEMVTINYTSMSVFYGVQIHILLRYAIFCFDWWIFWFELPQ
ncbi:MAG: hypothetical protein EAX96_07140 [Candidatus Lokiarchaeota archaeon]|nr:hypothetical protein [Candidatus Lokiarchaeota archaeon]